MIELSETFQLYQKEYIAKCQELQNSDIKQLFLKNKHQYQSTSKLIQQCVILQKQIDLELCSLPSNQKQLIQSKYKSFKRMISKKKQQFSQIQAPPEPEESQQQTDNLINQNDKLIQSKKLLYEANVMSDNIVEELGNQTKKLQNQNKKLDQTKQLLQTGNKIIDRIWIQKKKYKIIMYSLCVALGIIFTYHMF